MLTTLVDRRVVVNPRQARQLLIAVTYVGYQRRGPLARGQRLMALYACMYFAALRPAGAVALRQQACYLPVAGWGRLTLEKSRPEVNRRWSNSASAHAERGLKQRTAAETRQVPIPAELVTILRQHIDTFAVAPDGRTTCGTPPPPCGSTPGCPQLRLPSVPGTALKFCSAVYAKCVDGGDKIANIRIDAALGGSS